MIDVAGECVGEVGLSDIDQRRGAALIGWWVAAGHRGNGYATEAIGRLADAAVGFGVHTLVAQIGVANEASIHIATRAGFTLLRAGDDATPHVYVRR
ncbi:MAG: GNAT family N-acetyltransferase [Actinomycetota bacterium]